MIKIEKYNKFAIYLFFIVLFSVLTANAVSIISPENNALLIFAISIVAFFILHKFYYRLYCHLINYQGKIRISTGLLQSSIIGGLLITILSVFNYFFVRLSTYSIKLVNSLIITTFILIIGIYLFCILILAKNDIRLYNKQNSFRVIIGAVLFYGLNLLICYIIIGVLTLGVNSF